MTHAGRTGWAAELARHPAAREALLFEGRSVSFGELAGRVETAGRALTAVGIRPGARVGLLAPPSQAGFVLIHALLDRGIVMVPLNLRWTARELRFAVELAGVDWLVTDTGFESAAGELAEAVGCGLLRLESDGADGPRLERMRSPGPGASESRSPSDSALILFTSGTSGSPKGAVLSLANLRASALGSISLLGSDPDDRWLCCMPLFHIGGLSILIRSALAGSSVALHPEFNVHAVRIALEEGGVTRVSFVSAMLSRLLDLRGERPAPEALRLVLLGGGPAPQSLLMHARRLGYPIAPTYGLTEAASQVATRPPDLQTGVDTDEDLAAGLRPMPGTEIRIVSEAGVSLGPGEIGEIEVRGTTVMAHYLDDPDATRSAFHDGWLVTGDLGRLDAKGGLRVLDRRSDLILSGGENVYPAEIESVLIEHPAIAEAGVVGIEDEAYGARPVAYLVPAPGRHIDVSEILEFCRARLANYKLPVELFVVDALPRTASGKLLRRELGEDSDGSGPSVDG